MLFKRIMGFVLLTAFIGFMGNKFMDSLAGNDDAPFIIAIAVVVLLMILLGINRILTH